MIVDFVSSIIITMKLFIIPLSFALYGMDATIFWAGDSRVYVFRNRELHYQTEEHSVLNEPAPLRERAQNPEKRTL